MRAHRSIPLGVALVAALAFSGGCTPDERQPPPPAPIPVKDMAGPCDFLTDAEREGMGLEPGNLVTADGPAPATACTFRETDATAHTGDFADSVKITFLATTVEVARAALDNVETQGLFTAGRMSPYAQVAGKAYYQRQGVRLGEATCERLFGVEGAPSGLRTVEVSVTIELAGPASEEICQSATRLAAPVEAKLPRA